MRGQVNRIAAADKVAALVFRDRPGVTSVEFSRGQWVQSSPGGEFVQLWEAVPPDLDAQVGQSVLVYQWSASDVLCVLSEEEEALLWDGGGTRSVISAGMMIRMLVLRDGTMAQASADCFFQTDRARSANQLWRLKSGAPPVRPEYWYPTPSEHVEMVAQWPLADVRLTLSEDVLKYAREHHLLGAIISR